MKFGWTALAVLGALLIPAQAAMNAKLRIFVYNPLYTAVVNHLVGFLVSLTVVGLTIRLNQPAHARGVFEAPWWALCGGVIGACFIVIATLSVPRIGSASFSVAVIGGQLVGALLLDQFGWLGLAQRSLTPARLTGVLLIFVSIWLMQRE
ncbi:MAG: DMT family transporter [Acidobacteria bacterium]|nr:DMT family transporter [Acidobacteriota bacterium]MBI3422686.1 DMT family transporter [Acidobacteriota bacterium]